MRAVRAVTVLSGISLFSACQSAPQPTLSPSPATPSTTGSTSPSPTRAPSEGTKVVVAVGGLVCEPSDGDLHGGEPDVGEVRFDHLSGAGEPRARDGRRAGVLRLLAATAAPHRSPDRRLQLRPRVLAPDRARFVVLRRRMRGGLTAERLPGARSRRDGEALHPGVLAPPVLQLRRGPRPGDALGRPGVLGRTPRGPRGRDPERARARLPALREAGRRRPG